MFDLALSLWDKKDYLARLVVLANIWTYLAFFIWWAVHLVRMYSKSVRQDDGLVRCLMVFIRQCAVKSLKLALSAFIILSVFGSVSELARVVNLYYGLISYSLGLILIQYYSFKVLDGLSDTKIELTILIRIVRLGFIKSKAKDKVA